MDCFFEPDHQLEMCKFWWWGWLRWTMTWVCHKLPHVNCTWWDPEPCALRFKEHVLPLLRSSWHPAPPAPAPCIKPDKSHALLETLSITQPGRLPSESLLEWNPISSCCFNNIAVASLHNIVIIIVSGIVRITPTLFIQGFHWLFISEVSRQNEIRKTNLFEQKEARFC